VYVWNQWVFQHEILEHRRLPYFTDTILSLDGGANLSLHNYTPFQNLVALPLIRWLGVVPAFNVVYLLMTILTAYAAWLLSRHVTGRAPESWLAGLLFAYGPILITRGGGHFSLVAAAPLAVFLLLLLRAADRPRLRDAAALGATTAWAAGADVYYGVYCITLAALFLLGRLVTVGRREPGQRGGIVPRTLDVLLLCVAGLIASVLITGGWQFTIAGQVASIRSLYTPMLVLTLLAVGRLAWACPPIVAWPAPQDAWRVARLASVAALCTAALLSPLLYAAGVRVAGGLWESDPVFWRSSPGGVDLLAFLLPNPNHPLAPDAVRRWLTPRPDAYFENVASLTFVALATIAVAWRAGWRIPRLWGGIALAFGALALGPFVHVAGLNTQVPGPWALVRYVPILGMTRTPTRFTVVLMLALAVLFACALVWMGRRWPGRRRALLAGVGALLLVELLPAPRPLFSASIPGIYRHVAAAPHDVRVLELPFGVRDGTASDGNFTARSQFFQTAHEKPLIGGYMSRIARRRVLQLRRDGMLDALMSLSEGGTIDAARRRTLVEAGPAFVTRARLGFVIVDRERGSEALRDFAVEALRLEPLETDGPFELYRPAIARDTPKASS
jgi:hypothetical protein